jgi:hypothetical protein
MEEERKKNPGIAEEEIRRPVIITGLPRTGTTLLHNLLTLEGFKEKSVMNLLESIEKSKQQGLARLIYGLGIRHVGKYAAQLLASHYHSIDELAKKNGRGINPDSWSWRKNR